MMEDRFEVFPDPLNNWIVWTRRKMPFAETGNQVLKFLSEEHAREFCLALNENPASAVRSVMAHGGKCLI
jgi:hypothetical protein